MVQSVSSSSLEKIFDVETFFNQFSGSNQNKTKIKKDIIKFFQELKDSELIRSEFKIIKKNNSVIETNKLTSRLITQSRIIYFYEILT